jgi:DNA-binding CsgD family transcriptional regulator
MRLAESVGNREIAATTGLALQTVKNQLGAAFKRLGVGSRLDAVVLLDRKWPTWRENLPALAAFGPHELSPSELDAMALRRIRRNHAVARDRWALLRHAVALRQMQGHLRAAARFTHCVDLPEIARLPLTRDQLRALRLVESHSNAEIGAHLGMSKDQIEIRLYWAYRALGVSSRLEAANRLDRSWPLWRTDPIGLLLTSPKCLTIDEIEAIAQRASDPQISVAASDRRSLLRHIVAESPT